MTVTDSDQREARYTIIGKVVKMEKKKSHITGIIKKVAEAIVPIAVSVLLIVWLFHKVDFKTVIGIVRESCDYSWLLLMCLVLLISRSVRGIRWGIQLRAAGIPRMPVFAEMVSIWGAYALNLILTGIGEAWRCLYVAKRQKASLSTVVGTDLGDRISDAIMIVLLIGTTFFVARPALDRFMDRYSFTDHVLHILSSPWLWVGLGIVVAVLVGLLLVKTQNKTIKKIRTQIVSLWNGFRILFRMKHQVAFWSYTLVIWIAYFLLTYLCFFAFPFTRELIRPDLAYGLLPGLVVFIFGSISIAIPATGGLGPWNIAVMFALSLYGVKQADAVTYSIVVWAFQTVAQILMGVASAVYITFERRNHLTPVTELSEPPKSQD